MGTGSSKEATDGGGSEGNKDRTEDDDQAADGGQLYVSLKMENRKLTGDLVPHVYGSLPLVGSWDPSKAVIFYLHSFFLFLGFCSFLFSFFLSFLLA